MDIRKLQRAIVDGLEDVKAQNIAVFNTEHLSAMFERVIIASGSSNRQTKALASSVRDAVKSRGMQVLSTEGEDNGEWIIVDCGAAVAHIMQPAIREYYHLEEIWGGKAVKLKLGAAAPGLPKAGEAEARSRAAAARPAARKAAAKAATEGRAVAEAPVARKAASNKAGANTGVAKKAPSKKAAAKTAPAKRVPAKKAAAKPPATGRAAAAQPAAPRRRPAG